MILELGQYLTSFEWVRVTAEYSNAVLVAVMPYVSDVAQKLDLPVPHPTTAEDVVYCNVTVKRSIAATIGTKGNWHFSFSRGYVDTIQGPREFFTLQDFDKIPDFYGELKMTKTEAIQFGRDVLRKLEIPLESVFAEQEPRVTEPERFGTNLVPHYRIEWLNPVSGSSACVDMDIDGNARQLARLRIFSKSLERPPPKVNVVPPPHPNSPHWPLCNPDYAWKLIPIAFKAIEEYANTLALPVPHPLTTNHVARFSLADNGGWPHAEIELTNGWRFVYRNSMVNGHYAPDNLFNSDNRPIRIKEFAGKWNMTEDEAIDLVKRSLGKFRHPTNLVHMNFKPDGHKPALPGIPRYSFSWYLEDENDIQSKVEAEVDADKRELKSLYYDDKFYWKKPPPIDVPLSLPMTPATNSPTGNGPKPLKPKPPSRPFTPFIPSERK